MTLLRLKPFLLPPFFAVTPSGLAQRLFLSSAFSSRTSPSPSTSSTGSVSIEYEPWSGLQSWRVSPINEDRFWGPHGPQPLPKSQQPLPRGLGEAAIASASSLAEMGAVVLSTSDPELKSQLSHLAVSRWRSEGLPVGVWEPPDKPARPPRPHLVSPKEIPAPKDSVLPLNAYMLHNLAHVELNAIDLAWDTVVRFSSFLEVLGEGFFADFAHVADDESRHFGWCSQRLMELGFRYGDMPAHNMLWKECEKSSDNVAARLAVIPMVQEARGLDAGPRLVQKLVGFGDNKTSKIVARIADEETAHVSVGVDWFIALCQRMNLPPCSTFKELLRDYNVELKGPFNHSAREKAGIPRDWYDPSSKDKQNTEQQQQQQLSVVYDRLARIIAMENENSSLNPMSRLLSKSSKIQLTTAVQFPLHVCQQSNPKGERSKCIK